MKLLSPAISRLARFRHWRIEQWFNDPIAAQREVLQDLITHGQYTQFGLKYQFAEIFDIRKFKATVPIHEYEDLKPYIEQILEAEEGILWNTPVQWFAKSSGTTSDKSKFIPITQESLEDCHFQGAKDVHIILVCIIITIIFVINLFRVATITLTTALPVLNLALQCQIHRIPLLFYLFSGCGH